jgi:actin beta/gamma 1
MKQKGGKYQSYLKGVNDLLSPVDVKKIVVVDIGSNYIRVGLSGENFPLLNLQCLVAKSKNINTNDLTQTKLPDLFATKGINVLAERPADYSLYYPLMSESLASFQDEYSQILLKSPQEEQGLFTHPTRMLSQKAPMPSNKDLEAENADNDSVAEEELDVKRPTMAQMDPTALKKLTVADVKPPTGLYAKQKRSDPLSLSADNWGDLENYMKYVFEEVLQLETANLEILFVDSIAQHMDFRQKLSEIFFENLRVQSINFVNSAVCGLFATGRWEGIAVEMGHSSTNVVPIYGGIVLNHALHVSHYGGREATKVIQAYLKQKGMDLGALSNDFISTIESIKEKLSACCLNYDDEIKKDTQIAIEESSIELPDGSVIELDRETKYASGEILLRPSRGFWNTLPAIRDGEMDLIDKVFHSIGSCEFDMQRRFAKNIVLCGGASQTNGLVRRFKNDLGANLPSSLRGLEIGIESESNVPFSGWIGGSILGSISTFQNLKIKKAEWDEAGDAKGNLLMKRIIA